MRFAASLSTHPEPAIAAGEIIGEIAERLTEIPDLAIVFAAGKRIDALAEMVDAVHSLLLPHALIAVSASGTLAGTEEAEDGDSFAVWAGSPGQVTPVRLEILPGSEPIITGLPSLIESGSVLTLVTDPFTFDAGALVDKLTVDYPGVALCGGIASAGTKPGANRLWLDDQSYSNGAVGVIFPPGVAEPVVSQGCKPIGRPWVVTKGNGNIIRELGGVSAMQRLQDTVAALDETTRLAATSGLHLGFVVANSPEDPDQGDFLVCSVLGGDSKTGAVAVAAQVGVGQLVQFQVRDAKSSADDLVRVLTTRHAGSQSALVFTCNGRGIAMFDEPSHDARLVSEFVDGAVGGMFCAGELGPVAGQNAIHTFTATALLFGE